MGNSIQSFLHWRNISIENMFSDFPDMNVKKQRKEGKKNTLNDDACFYGPVAWIEEFL